jgi:hypothetical protein
VTLRASLGDAKSSLGDAESSLGDAKSSVVVLSTFYSVRKAHAMVYHAPPGPHAAEAERMKRRLAEEASAAEPGFFASKQSSESAKMMKGGVEVRAPSPGSLSSGAYCVTRHATQPNTASCAVRGETTAYSDAQSCKS